jgi:hypothetical protein
VQAILFSNYKAVDWLKLRFKELEESIANFSLLDRHNVDECTTEDNEDNKQTKFKDFKDFLDSRISYWFNDYASDGTLNAEQTAEKHQEMVWQNAPSIFVGGSVPLEKAQSLVPALNFLSMRHSISDDFVKKLLRNDYQVDKYSHCTLSLALLVLQCCTHNALVAVRLAV